MLKQWLPIVLAAGLIATAAPFVAAQDNQSPPASPNSDQQGPPPQGDGRMHRGMPDPAQRTKELTKHLNLTADQQTKVLSIFQSEQSQMETARQDTSASQPDRHAKMMDLRKTADTQVRALLDSNQQKKWDEMQARRQQWGQDHHGPPNGDQQPPPAPQQ
jgi:Spy/CpxP family protein refolding chaperone